MNGALVAFVIHQVEDKPRFLRAVRELLRPGGWCCFVEYHRKPGDSPERRLHYDELETLAQDAGFAPRGWRNLNDAYYMMRLRKG